MDWLENFLSTTTHEPLYAHEEEMAGGGSVAWHNAFGTAPDFSVLALGDMDISSPDYCWSAPTTDEW